KLLHGIGSQDIRRTEDVERPGRTMSLHEVQQSQRAATMEEGVFIHHKKRPNSHLRFELGDDSEQLVPHVIEVHELAFATEHRRGGTEVTAERTADRWNERCRHVPSLLAYGNTHAARP